MTDDPARLSAPAKPKISKFFYTGELPEAAKIGFPSLLLSLVTLGGYYARAHTDIVTWLARHLNVNKRIHAVYSGTTEGFAKRVYPYALGAVVTAALIQWSVMTQNYLIFLVLLAILYGLITTAFHLANVYRLNHLTIGNAEVRQNLLPTRYMMLVLKRAFFNVTTLGYKIPKSDLEKWELFISHIQIGNTRLRFAGNLKNLFLVHLISLGLPLILGLTFVLMLAPVIAGDPSIKPERIAAAQDTLTFLLYATIVCGFLGRAWYRAALLKECMRGLSCGPLRFRFAASGHDLFKLRAVNTMLMFVTLGLALPVIRHRNLDFLARHTAMQGDVDAVFGIAAA